MTSTPSGRLTAADWPIAAAMLPFAGPSAQDAPGSRWLEQLCEVKDAGFDLVDVTDNWVRIGDLEGSRIEELSSVAADAGVGLASVSAIRRSVVDAETGLENLAYSHRTLESAAALGIRTVSFGLHQALTAAQQRELWFWTVEGHRDRPEDWPLAVERLRELGRHAGELGIVMSLEMYEDTFLGTADSAVRLVEDIGLDVVGLNPDIGNLVRLHRPIESPDEAMRKCAPYMNFWHMKNYLRDEDPEKGVYFAAPAPMESGVINYRAAFRMALDAGFQGVLCAENYGGDGLSVCASNRDYLRRHVLPKRAGYALGESRVRQSDLSGLRA
jgi:sugar phosphate isomerase/epimerase